jgi:hypothetical protein
MDALWEGVQQAASDPVLSAHRNVSDDRSVRFEMDARFAPSRERDGAAEVVVLSRLSAAIEIPFRLTAGRFVPWLVAAKGRPTGDLWDLAAPP